MGKAVLHTFASKKQELKEAIETQEKVLQKDTKALQIIAVASGVALLAYTFLQRQNRHKVVAQKVVQEIKKDNNRKEIIIKTPKKTIFGTLKKEVWSWLQKTALEELQKQAISITTELMKKYGNPERTKEKSESS